MRPTTPRRLPQQQQPRSSSPPYTPTTPRSPFHPSSPSSPETPSHQRHRSQNFSRPLASQPRGFENRYTPLTWQNLGASEGGGYIQPLGPGTNQFSYIPARGPIEDPSSSPRSSSPEPSEDDDDDDSSVSPRSLTDDEEFVKKEPLSSANVKAKRSGKEIENSLVDEDEDRDVVDKETSFGRGRRRQNTIKAKSTFTLEEMPSRSQERHFSNLRNSDNDSLLIIHPDRYSDAETAPSRDRSMDVHINNTSATNPKSPKHKTSHDARENSLGNENDMIETDSTDTDPTSALDPKIMESMSTLNCESEDDRAREAWIRQRQQEKRMKRWSRGSQKRSITQSIGSGTDEEDLHVPDNGMSVIGGVGGGVSAAGGTNGDGVGPPGGDESGVSVGGSARRLRRKTGAGGERPVLRRISLLFDDPPRRIVEVEEPESDFGGGRRRKVVGVEVEVEVLDDELPYFFGGEGDIDMDD